MPKVLPKEVQSELKNNKIWPVYWLYGGEAMKKRELAKRILKTVCGDAENAFQKETLDGTEVGAQAIVDSAMTLTLGGGTRVLWIQNADKIKPLDALEPLLQEPTSKENLQSVCIFFSKDLDGRKKFSKKLVANAAAVQCEEVGEDERVAWIEFLAKRRKMDVSSDTKASLSSIDPWNLDIIDQELAKLSIMGDEDVLISAGSEKSLEWKFIDSFFKRDRKNCLRLVETLAKSPEISIPLLGLFAWNLRQVLVLSDPGKNRPKVNPYVAERARAWMSHWDRGELLQLQTDLGQLDFETKQTPKTSLGLWSDIVLRYSH